MDLLDWTRLGTGHDWDRTRLGRAGRGSPIGGDRVLLALPFRRVKIEPLTATIGAGIDGVDLSSKLSDDTVAERRTALWEGKGFFSRGQHHPHRAEDSPHARPPPNAVPPPPGVFPPPPGRPRSPRPPA